MKRLFNTLGLICALALATPMTALASPYAYVDCSLASNHCNAEADGGPNAYRLLWWFDYSGTDAIFPDCTNKTHCSFWCPRYPGPIIARVFVYDANFNLLAASDPAPAVCTQQDELLP